MRNAVALSVYLLLFCFSCSVQHSKDVGRRTIIDGDVCLQNIPDYRDNFESGPIVLSFQIDTIFMGDSAVVLNQELEVFVDRESELIVLSADLAVKFFHLESFEYGRIAHVVKHEIFIKLDSFSCWTRWVKSGYSNVNKRPKSLVRGRRTDNKTFGANHPHRTGELIMVQCYYHIKDQE